MTTPPITQQFTPAPPRRRKLPTWPFIVAATLVVMLGASVMLAFTYLQLRPEPFAVTGTVTINATCGSTRGYDDIHAGTQVIITDAAGTVIATGYIIDGGRTTFSGQFTRCTLPFMVTDVPEGKDFYSIEISHRGKITFTEDQIRKPLTLTIG